MGKTRQILIFIWGGMILVFIGISAPTISFGEILAPVSVGEKTTKTEPLSKEHKKEVMVIRSESTGFRAEEPEVEQSSDPQLPQNRALSTKEPELVETTDASGGTMINLQGRFQCGLKVPHVSLGTSVEKHVPPAIP